MDFTEDPATDSDDELFFNDATSGVDSDEDVLLESREDSGDEEYDF